MPINFSTVSRVPEMVMENFKLHEQQRCRDHYDAVHQEVCNW